MWQAFNSALSRLPALSALLGALIGVLGGLGGALGVLVVWPGERVTRLEAEQAKQRQELDVNARTNTAVGRWICLRSDSVEQLWIELPCDSLLPRRYGGHRP